jgi:hypothetical protein
MARSEERAARNEVMFREANEKISAKGEDLDFVGKIPFLCECEEPRCTEVLRLEPEEYEHARSNPRYFVLSPGHETRGAQPIESNDRFAIVEKTGRSGEIADQTDPRSIA